MLKFGFFDSINGDRRYNARDISEMFDGIILDGVFLYVGDHFRVTPGPAGSRRVNVGTGQGWFHHTKIRNTSELSLFIPTSTSGLNSNRTDGIILEINESTRSARIFVRENYNKVDLVDDDLIHQYPLATITAPMNAGTITAAHITNLVGVEVPYVVPPNGYVDPSGIIQGWNDRLQELYSGSKTDFDTMMERNQGQFNTTLFNHQKTFNDLIREMEGDGDSLEYYAKVSESWAVGDTGIRTGENTDNSKYYSQLSEIYKNQSKDSQQVVEGMKDDIYAGLGVPQFVLNPEDGCLYYSTVGPGQYHFTVDEDGDLEWGLE